MQMTGYDFYLMFKPEFDNISDDELIIRFNDQAGVDYFGGGRQGYLMALNEQLKLRKIDFSEVGNDKYMCYKYCVVLKEHRLVKLANLEFHEILIMFINYLAKYHPEQAWFRPIIIKYNDDELVYKIRGYRGCLLLETNRLIEDMD